MYKTQYEYEHWTVVDIENNELWCDCPSVTKAETIATALNEKQIRDSGTATVTYVDGKLIQPMPYDDDPPAEAATE